LGWLNNTEVVRVKELFTRANLPVVAPDLGIEKYLDLMGMDKKVESGKLRFVLLKKLGQAVITADVPLHLLQETLQVCVDE
jgi:3-dehydroquinate synthase